MIALRVEIAREAGSPAYVDYAFRHRERFDYGVAETHRVPGGDRAGRRPARPADPGGAAADARASTTLRPWDLAVDPLGRPPLRPFTDVEQAGRGDRGDLHRRRSRARARSSPTSATQRPARPGQPQGEGPGRLPDDAGGRPPAVHLHERRGPRRRRPDPAPRRGPRLPRPGQPGRAAGRLSREPDRVLRGRLDVDGAARRPRPRARSTTRTTPTARTASCSKGSS